MTDPKVFISLDLKHNLIELILFVGQSYNTRTNWDIMDWSFKEEIPEETWIEKVKEKINKCNLMIVLVGKYMKTATGVNKEIQIAKECNVPIFGVYVDGTDVSSDLPVGLERFRTIPREWEKIGKWIDNCLEEGKNEHHLLEYLNKN